jgi:hypothetical protein
MRVILLFINESETKVIDKTKSNRIDSTKMTKCVIFPQPHDPFMEVMSVAQPVS